MKKTLIALAALAATSAFAQSTVTLYGRMDIGYAVGKTTDVSSTNVTTTTRNNGVLSGDTFGLSTNLWGIKGSEDLGGGMKANFNLESSLNPADGASTGFTRRAVLGMSGGFGNVDLGRDYTPMFQVAGLSDPFGQSGLRTVNLGTADGVRASNAVHYTTPVMSGFSAKVMLGNVEGGSNDGTTDKSTSTRNTGLSLNYANGPLAVAYGMGTVDTLSAPTAAGFAINQTTGLIDPVAAKAAAQGKTEASALSATYDFGAAKLYAGHIRAKTQASTAVQTYSEATETNVAVAVPMGKMTLIAQYGRNTGDLTTAGAAAGSASGNDYALGLTYELSKRTTAYVKTGVYNRADLATAAGAAAGSTKSEATAIGLRHTF